MAGARKRLSIRRKPRARAAAYMLLVRGADGRLRSERFADAASYRARVSALAQSQNRSVSIDDIIGLLENPLT